MDWDSDLWTEGKAAHTDGLLRNGDAIGVDVFGLGLLEVSKVYFWSEQCSADGELSGKTSANFSSYLRIRTRADPRLG